MILWYSVVLLAYLSCSSGIIVRYDPVFAVNDYIDGVLQTRLPNELRLINADPKELAGVTLPIPTGGECRFRRGQLWNLARPRRVKDCRLVNLTETNNKFVCLITWSKLETNHFASENSPCGKASLEGIYTDVMVSLAVHSHGGFYNWVPHVNSLNIALPGSFYLRYPLESELMDVCKRGIVAEINSIITVEFMDAMNQALNGTVYNIF